MKAVLDLDVGQMQKELSLFATALNNANLLVLARDVAKLISCERGSVTIDQVRQHAALAGRRPSSPNLWGTIFNEKGWRVVDETRSIQKQNHKRRIYRWRWEP